MSAPAQPVPSPTPRSFAGLLADYASPEKKFPPARDPDGLADDIATLSYEHALKTHARYRPAPDFARGPQEQPEQPAFPGCAPLFADDRAHESPALERGAQQSHTSAHSTDAAIRKCASVTVRLTRAEDEQLRQRAAEAGMTLSAYLRSCAFEVETLRAEVKQTIAELRHADAPLKQRNSQISRLFAWRKRSGAPIA